MAATPALEGRPPRWREVFRGRRGRLTAGLLLLEALVAMHSLVVVTILPDVRRDLGMVQLYGLVFTAASLATLGAIPIAGRGVDRLGPRRVLPFVLALFTGGLVVAATAPAMPVVLVGQFLTGAGGGGLYAMSLGTVAKTYPDRLRPRVLALLASMWIVPGLAGPPLGAALVSTVGWRWAFLAPVPIVVVGWVLIAPALGLVTREGRADAAIGVRWPVQLMVGAGITFTAITIVRPWTVVAVAVGVAIALPALTQIVPAGTFRAARGVPASAVTAFLLSVGFLALDAFLTLMLTEVRGLSTGEAGLAVTGATVTWALGSGWQSSRAESMSLSRLLVIGGALVLVGGGAVASALVRDVPLVAAYVGWCVVGFGMGVAFPTIPLAAMRAAGAGEEGTELSSVLLMDMLGVATGAGLGGGAVALADATGRSITSGIAASFAIGLLAIAGLIVLARRIDVGPDGDPSRGAAPHDVAPRDVA
jgi:MFS family permease